MDIAHGTFIVIVAMTCSFPNTLPYPIVYSMTKMVNGVSSNAMTMGSDGMKVAGQVAGGVMPMANGVNPANSQYASQQYQNPNQQYPTNSQYPTSSQYPASQQQYPQNPPNHGSPQQYVGGTSQTPYPGKKR